MMEEQLILSSGTIPEATLRDVAKNISKILPDFGSEKEALVVKSVRDVLVPLLDTSDVADLHASHRAAATNALCAIIEHCQRSENASTRSAILDDDVWFRLFDIFLQRSDNAKGKSMRQLLLLLTELLQQESSPQTTKLRSDATSTFIDIIHLRQDRLKVKPALQGLSHFLQKGVISLHELLDHVRLDSGKPDRSKLKEFFTTLLGWVVHHDTALSAGYMLKNFLTQLRQSNYLLLSDPDLPASSIWIEPVIKTLLSWPDRIQEFKTHVFPHCFLPNLVEYLHFLSYLHFNVHVLVANDLPQSEDAKIGLEPSEEFQILLAAIETGKQLGLVKDDDHPTHRAVYIADGAIHVPDSVFGNWMSHTEPDVRVAGLFLSVYSTAGTRPITKSTFKYLKRNIVHLHSDVDANFRKDVLNYTQRLFDRLRGSTGALAKARHRNNAASGQREDIAISLRDHQGPRKLPANDHQLRDSLRFIRWYIQFLNRELRPTASYQRRVTALRCLTIVLRSGIDPKVPFKHLSKSAQGQLHWSHSVQVVTPELIHLLLESVLDAFDDVRGTSTSLLTLCLESLTGSEKKKQVAELVEFIRRAESMMLSSGRADQADGVARAVALLSTQCSTGVSNIETLKLNDIRTKINLSTYLMHQLDDTLRIVQEDMASAVNGQPVHGIFAAFRYIMDSDTFYSDMPSASAEELQQWKEIHVRISSAIEKLWSCIRDVLCADAPEGHVPEELEEEQSLDTKEILSYSWRGLKEASVLLRTIVSKAPLGLTDKDILTPAEFERLGKQCFTQLVELRHRGAFSTVAQTFAAFCRRCFSVDDQTLRALPTEWYEEALRSIQDKANAITRRSAGIPALISGILGAEPQSGGTLFARAMKDLIREASLTAVSSNIEESRLPQVHALNCIKEIFTTSKLSAVSEAYIGDGLDLAARNLNSSIWPIRNCSLMLFKALIERLLGSDEAQDWKERERAKTSRFSYENYPSLVGILKNLLDPNGALKKSMTTIKDSSSPMDLHGAEGVFPALQILRQATPPESHRAEILKSVSYLLGSPHWHLRDMAARTLVSLQQPEECFEGVLGCFSGLDTSQNIQHGLLLCSKYALRKLLRSGNAVSAERFDTILAAMLAGSHKLNRTNTSPFVRSAFLEAVNICGSSMFAGDITPTSTLQAWSNLCAALRLSGAPDGHVNGDSLLRISSKRSVFLNQLVVQPTSIDDKASARPGAQLPDVLIELAKEDPDTCSAVLDTLANVIPELRIESPTTSKHGLALQVFRVIMLTADEEVRSKAQLVLADLLLDQDLREPFFKHITDEDLETSLVRFESQCLQSSPSNMQGAIRLLGSFLDLAFALISTEEAREIKTTRSVFARLARYIRLLRMIIIDTNPFDARLAATQSLLTLQTLFSTSPNTDRARTTLLALALILYDLLNDDDDEIRALAATATHRLITAQSSPNTPLAALQPTIPLLMSKNLATFLTTPLFKDTASTARTLRSVALQRLGGGAEIPSSPAPIYAREFEDVLDEALEEDTSLFVKERQNLWKDDGIDALFFMTVLIRLGPASASSSLLTSSGMLRSADTHMHNIAVANSKPVPVNTRVLEDWLRAALAVLTRTTASRSSGALSWTSKVEVFTLVFRVVCFAEVLLHWNTAQSSKILEALARFAEAGRAEGMHPGLLGRMEGVLGRSVRVRLGRVGRGLMGVLEEV